MAKGKLSEHAKALSAAGAKKGGLARAKSLTPEQRAESARKAATARWGSDVPRATHGDPEHPLRIGNVEIACYVLEDGTRVVSQRGLQTSLGLNVSGGAQRLHKILTVLERKGIDTNDLTSRIATPLVFKTPRGSRAHGFEATVLADFCEVILKAKDKAGTLRSNQLHVAKQCEILVRGFARVGIIALVDEATGYQHDRSRRALEEILDAFIKDELGKWAKRFPDEFYRELFRLKGLQFIPFPKKRPMYVGHWTNDLVYKRLAPGVLDQLREKNPPGASGRRKTRHHQFLTDDVGHPKLQEHLASVITLMRACDDWAMFHKMLDRSLPKYKELPLYDGLDDESE